MQEQLARPRRLVIGAAALRIFGDMSVDQVERATALVRRIGIGDVGPPRAQRLHLGAGQHEAGLERVLDRVVEAGFAVFGDELAALALLGHRLDPALDADEADFGERGVDLGL